MSNHIKLLTDAACDIPPQLEREYEIDIMPIPIAIEGKSYLERVDFTNEEFYKVLESSPEIPVTSHITTPTFLEKYEELYRAGVTDVIQVTICGKGSNMYSAALMARDMFYEEHPGTQELFGIHILDSNTYSIGYGYAILEAAKMARAGKEVSEILSYLTDYFQSVEIYFSVYSLDFAKKSGRVNCAAAFVGEVLGLRPIISIIDGEIKIINKVRGDKNVVPKLAEMAKTRRVGDDTPYALIEGTEPLPVKELQGLLQKQLGRPSEGIYQAGASITINAGPRLVGVVVRGKKRG